jgi:squalene-hopene/tetraprenyl-beta-curcumene cyclase
MTLKARFPVLIGTAFAALAIVLGYAARLEAEAAAAWNPQAAAKYLDGREDAWQAWDKSQRDRGTICVSCHTQASYGLARPVLHQALNDQNQSAAERTMLASIRKRVGNWAEMQPVYPDNPYGAGKSVESRNSESVLNAFILSSYDRLGGHMSDMTRTAFDLAWALQTKSGPDAGSWVWQNFGLAPFESNESQYQWAALIAMAIGKAPDDYRADPSIAGNLDLLISYLRSHYEGQPLLNQIAALWAAEVFPAILNANQRAQLVQKINQLQHSDGGWCLADLGPWGARADGSPAETRSDGYATALVALVLEESGTDDGDSHLGRAIQWLEANQDKSTGAWTAWSLNKSRDPASMPGKFMSDTATAYAVLALEAAKH